MLTRKEWSPKRRLFAPRNHPPPPRPPYPPLTSHPTHLQRPETCVGDWCEGFDEEGYPTTPDVAAAVFESRKDDHCVGDWCEDALADEASNGPSVFESSASKKDHCVGDWCEDPLDRDDGSDDFPTNLIPKDLAWTSDPKFVAANGALLFAETALFTLAMNLQPITTGPLCGPDPTAFGCMYVGAHQAFADEIGAGMVAVALAYTGAVTLLAAENFAKSRDYLLARGVPQQELEGVTAYRFVRGAEAVLRDTGNVAKAVAYLRDVRANRGAFVHSYANKSKTYSPWWKKPAAPTPPAVQSVQAENKSNVVEFRRNNKPGAIDDEKVFEKVSKEKQFPAGTLPWKR